MKVDNKVELLLDSNVYVQRSKQEILFYNIYNKKNYVYKISDEVCNVENNRVVWKEYNKEVDLLIDFIESNGMGRKVNSQKPFFILKNNFDILYEMFSSIIEREDAKLCTNSFVSLVVCLNQWKESDINEDILNFQGLFNINEQKENIKGEVIKKLLTCYSFKNFKKIVFTGEDIFSIPLFYELLDFCENRYKVELLISFSDYLKIKKDINFFLFKNINIRVMCDAFYLSTSEIKLFNDVTIIGDIYVKNGDEVKKIRKYNIEKYISCINIIPYYKNNIDFLSHILTYSVKDILRTKHSIIQIIRNKLINELFWGKLIIQEDGTVYTGPNHFVGNIKIIPFQNILYQAGEVGSLWRYTRRSFKFCQDCIFQNLCPPVSSIEILTNRVFCDRKN